MYPKMIPSPKNYEISEEICLVNASIFTEEKAFLPG